MSQRVVSESVSDEDTAAAAEAVVVLRNSLLEIVDIENCPPKRKNREFTRSRLPKSLTVKVSHPILIISLKSSSDAPFPFIFPWDGQIHLSPILKHFYLI